MRKTFILVVISCIISSIGGGYLAYRLLRGGETIVIKEKEYITNNEESIEKVLTNLKKSEVQFDVMNEKNIQSQSYSGFYISNDGFVLLPYIKEVIEKKANLLLQSNHLSPLKLYADPLKHFIIVSLPPSDNKLSKSIEFETEASQYPGKKFFVLDYNSLHQYRFFASYITEMLNANSEGVNDIYSKYSFDRSIALNQASFVFNFEGKLMGITLYDEKGTSSFIYLSRINTALDSIAKDQSIKYANFPFSAEINYFEGFPLNFGATVKSVSKSISDSNILPGDVIFEINHKEIKAYKGLYDSISEKLPGETVQLKIFRYNDAVSKEQANFLESFDKQTFEISIVLGEI